jgi:YHS domain-containing protein
MSITITGTAITTLAILLGGLAPLCLSEAALLQCGGCDHATTPASESTSKAEQAVGDPYTLSTDPVSGKELGALGSQVILSHEGRELRFAGEETSRAFQKDPAKYLSAVDRQLREQQRDGYPLATCPITGEKPGEMGEAIELVVGNRLVRVCCQGCVKKVQKDPAAVIAKLDAAVVERQGPGYSAKTCPVTGKELGGMGQPVDVVIGTRLTRVCCKGCVKQIAADPLRYLAESAPAKGDSQAAGHGTHGH